MKTLKLYEDFYWVGIQNPDLRVFDIIMETKYGTTYNSYLLKTDDGVVLFETAKDKFFKEYLEKIQEFVKLEDIKYVVCNHTEPDHSGSLSELIKINPDITVVSSNIANGYLKEILNIEFKSLVVNDGDELKVGNKTLKFISAINLHWPDAMYTYIEEDSTLVTCDTFGAHYAFEDILLSNVVNKEEYNEAFDYYTMMIMGPFKPFVLRAMDKIKDLDIKLIALGHGPVIDQDIKSYIDRYIEFASPKELSKKVVIPYVTAYGYTEIIAKTIKEVIEENNIECNIYDLTKHQNHQEIIDDMISATGIMYGCPTLLGDALPPIYNIMNSILPVYHGTKVVSAFGSYGWSGEAVPNMITRLKQQRMKVVDEGYRVRFKPSAQQINEIKHFAINYLSKL